MSPTQITPELLLEQIDNATLVSGIDLAHNDVVLVIEIQSQQFRLLELQYSTFCNFRVVMDVPLPPAAQLLNEPSEQNLDRLGKLLTNFRARQLGSKTYQLSFILGDLAQDSVVIDTLSAAFSTTFENLNDTNMIYVLPSANSLVQRFQEMDCETRNSLVIQLATLVEDGFEPRLELMDYPIYGPGQPVRDNVPLGNIQLTAPIVNEPFLLLFKEMNQYGSPTRWLYYLVIALQKQFEVIVYVNPHSQSWDIRMRTHEAMIAPPNPDFLWTGKPSVRREHDYPPLPTQIQIQTAQPNIVLVVDSTLGMRRVFEQANKSAGAEDALPPEQENNLTDFNVVAELCQTVIDSLYYIDELRYSLVTYGYKAHNSQPVEFRDLSLKQSTAPMVYPETDRFVSANEMLSFIHDHFAGLQSAAKTWHRSVDEAMHVLNQDVAWDYSDRVALWIVQGPPFEYGVNESVPVDRPGFQGKYSYRAELATMVEEKGIINIVVFVNGEFNISPYDRLYRMSVAPWKEIAGVEPDGPQTFFEIPLANSEDAQIGHDIEDAILSKAPLRQRRVIISRPSPHNPPLRIPLLHDIDDEVIYREEY